VTQRLSILISLLIKALEFQGTAMNFKNRKELLQLVGGLRLALLDGADLKLLALGFEDFVG
jgi:hypothetical protein